MKLNFLLLILVALFSINANAQCPISITDDVGDGTSYLFNLATSAECSNYTINSTININAEPYIVQNCFVVGATTTLQLGANSNPVPITNAPIVFMVGGLTCTYNAMGVLPIQLASFSGYAKDKTNFLTWTTASESQNKGFDIERSSLNPSKGGKIEWQKIGFVAGNGTTNTRKEYSFEDKNPTGITYYRLKQLDFDGRFEYSKIIAIDTKGENMVSVFPNPSNGIFTITGIEDTEDETFTLINTVGQTLSITVQNDGQLDMSAYPSGVYYLRVASSGQVMKLVKE